METPNILALVERLRQVEGVTQVRYHTVLKPRFKDMVGEDGMSFVCIVPNKFIPENYIKFVTILSQESINNLELHDSIIDDVHKRVQKYLVHNIRPASF